MYLFIDGPGMLPLLNAVCAQGLEQKVLCVWDKQSGGMGSLYRNQAEFVVVAKFGDAPHINNVQLGRFKRTRTTPGPTRASRSSERSGTPPWRCTRP